MTCLGSVAHELTKEMNIMVGLSVYGRSYLGSSCLTLLLRGRDAYTETVSNTHLRAHETSLRLV